MKGEPERPAKPGWAVVLPMQADCHGIMARFRLCDVGAKEAIPDRESEAVVAVMFMALDRMMDPMHVRRDEDAAQYGVETARQSNIAMVKEG